MNKERITDEMSDTFRGDNAALVGSISALIALSDEGALSPHPLGGHARTLLASAAKRLAVAQNDTGPEVLRQVFGLCEATEDAEVSVNSVDSQAAQDFMRGRKFEARQIRRTVGAWFQDEFCGQSFMGEPAIAQPTPK